MSTLAYKVYGPYELSAFDDLNGVRIIRRARQFVNSR
jgi:hypothetical protein